jgi:hypothetical protein
MHNFCATAKWIRNLTTNRICDVVQKKIEGILVGHQIADAPNRTCDMQQIAHEIAHKIARV